MRLITSGGKIRGSGGLERYSRPLVMPQSPPIKIVGRRLIHINFPITYFNQLRSTVTCLMTTLVQKRDILVYLLKSLTPYPIYFDVMRSEKTVINGIFEGELGSTWDYGAGADMPMARNSQALLRKITFAMNFIYNYTV